MPYVRRLQNEYYEWMYKLISSDEYSRNLSYRKLTTYLNNIEFTYVLERDVNRAIDGIDFRYRFGHIFGYSRETIEQYLDVKPCSVLEMIIALAFRLENQIMDDYQYGDRTGQWFWNMIVSLGLGHMSDSNFDERYVQNTISIFLNRQYKPNGEGGLFTLNNFKYDLRNEEIWTQAMWYLDENFDFTV